MNILIDTHIALWAIFDTSQLAANLRSTLEDGNNRIYYSMASVWEIAIKHNLHKENIPMPEEEFVKMCDDTGFYRLNIRPEHIYAVKTLIRPDSAPKHNDPFDRLMIAQAKTEGMQFITHDHMLKEYNEPCVFTV